MKNGFLTFDQKTCLSSYTVSTLQAFIITTCIRFLPNFLIYEKCLFHQSKEEVPVMKKKLILKVLFKCILVSSQERSNIIRRTHQRCSLSNSSLRAETRTCQAGMLKTYSQLRSTPPHLIYTALTVYSKQIFPEMKQCGLSSNSYIHVSVSDLYIPTIGLPILLQENWRIDRGNI
jgi:hypothetical protein